MVSSWMFLDILVIVPSLAKKFSCSLKAILKSEVTVRPDLLNVLLLEPGGSKFFHFRKKIKFDHVIELIYMRTRLRHRRFVCGSAWKSFQAALCCSGPES